MKKPTLTDEDVLIDTIRHTKKERMELDNQTDMLLQAMKEKRRSKNEMRTSETDDLDAAIA